MDGLASVPQWISDVGKKQKNRNGYDQASALPFRFCGDDIQFCLITSRSKGRWCFPKGIIDPGETPEETALKEAEEEAGLTGEIVGEPLGAYEHSKWDRMLKVVVWLMKVDYAADEWEESHVRERQWVSYDDAFKLLDRRRLREFAHDAIRRLAVGASKG